MGNYTKNVKLAELRKFLISKGCNHIGTVGGHEKWSKQELLRPLILQTHVDPVSEFIVKQCIRALNTTEEDFGIFLGRVKAKKKK